MTKEPFAHSVTQDKDPILASELKRITEKLQWLGRKLQDNLEKTGLIVGENEIIVESAIKDGEGVITIRHVDGLKTFPYEDRNIAQTQPFIFQTLKLTVQTQDGEPVISSENFEGRFVPPGTRVHEADRERFPRLELRERLEGAESDRTRRHASPRRSNMEIIMTTQIKEQPIPADKVVEIVGAVVLKDYRDIFLLPEQKQHVLECDSGSSSFDNGPKPIPGGYI